MIVFLFTLFLKPFFACAQKTMIISISYMAQYMPTDQFQDRVLLLACRQWPSGCVLMWWGESSGSFSSFYQEHWCYQTRCVLVTQSCLTLCNAMGYSSPGFSIHWIFQARILEWVAISFSRGSSYPGIKPKSPAL